MEGSIKLSRVLGLIAVFTLLLVGCGDQGKSPPTANELTLTGKIVNWPGGKGTLIALVYDQEGLKEEIGTSTIDDNGRFQITLVAPPPTTLTLIKSDYESRSNCTTDIQVSNPEAKGASVNFAAENENGRLGVVQLSDNEGQRFGFYVYIDQAVTVQGTQTCTFSRGETMMTMKFNLNLSLKKGWNSMVVKLISESQNELNYTVQSGPVDDLNWRLISAP